MSRLRWGIAKKIISSVPEDGVLLLFNAHETKWRSVAGTYLKKESTIIVLEQVKKGRLRMGTGSQRPEIRDLGVYMKRRRTAI